MAGSIFFINSNRAIELTEAKYDSEDLFQELIENYPGLLAGDQITPDQPRKWIMISREIGIPESDGGGAQWFLDHLFIDQDAIPTFVEVKRSTDTRIRREVVAQMLDYAANASAYWPVDKIREIYFARCKEKSIEPLEELDIPPDGAGAFWEKVDSNLRLGKLRLLFAADEIPASLQRIIEFLNNQMTDTEVLGLEVKQFVSDDGARILVPRIIGKTQAAAQVKSRSEFVWTEESFLERVENISGQDIANVCEKALRAFEQLGCRIYWGSGQVQAGFVPVFDGRQQHQLCSFYSYSKDAKVEIYFQHFKAPFNDEARQRELLWRFNEIPGVHISDSKLFKRPSFSCSLLVDPVNFEKLISIFRNMIAEIKERENAQ